MNARVTRDQTDEEAAARSKIAAYRRLLHATDAAADMPRLRRQRAGRLLAGVCTGLAEHLSLPVFWVRAVFALAGFFGLGVVAYALLWVFVPQQAAGAERPVSAKERQQGVGLILLGAGLALAASWLGVLPAWFTGPAAVALVGAAVVWREADESQRRRWRLGARSGVADFVARDGRTPAVRVSAGAALVLVGIVIFLASNASISGLRFALLATLTTLIGAAVLTIPWWVRLVRDFNVERASRIRSQERAEIAAHLHDSVLQTLALIQKQAESSREVRKIARAQERELRNWLYGPDGYGQKNDQAEQSSTEQTLSRELARMCGEVEDTFAIQVQQVVVGECALDDQLVAQLAAAREALVNAAKHAGVSEVSVYAEAEQSQVSIYVRDRGVGFDPDSVSGDRHGLANSVRGRMERNGGRVRVRSRPGEGTEVQLEMPRE